MHSGVTSRNDFTGPPGRNRRFLAAGTAPNLNRVCCACPTWPWAPLDGPVANANEIVALGATVAVLWPPVWYRNT